MGSDRSGWSRRACAAGAALLAALTAGASLAGVGDDCPPNPEPGKCYEKVYSPAQYENYVEQVPVQDGYRTVVRQRRIREASFGWRTVPCAYAPQARRAGS
jgi:hypothetical protein